MGTEFVIYITGRSESLCALSFLTIGAWAPTNPEHNYPLWRSVGLLCMLLACTMKEVGLMLPFVVVALERCCTGTWKWKSYIPSHSALRGVALRIRGISQEDWSLSQIVQR